MKATIRINGEVYPSIVKVMKKQKTAPTTLRDAFNEYIELRTGILKPKTLKQYEHVRDEHFGRIMDMAVFCIGEMEIQAAFNDEINRGWSKKTLQNYKSIMKRVLQYIRPEFKPDIYLDKIDKVG